MKPPQGRQGRDRAMTAIVCFTLLSLLGTAMVAVCAVRARRSEVAAHELTARTLEAWAETLHKQTREVTPDASDADN